MKSVDVSAEKPKYMGSKRKQSNVEGCGMQESQVKCDNY